MKKTIAAAIVAAALASPAVHAQTTAYSVQIEALARVVGAFSLSYQFCTSIDQAPATIDVTAPRTVGSGSGRGGGYRGIVYTAIVSEIQLIDPNGDAIQIGTVAGGYGPVLPRGCYTLEISGNGTGTSLQGVVGTTVVVPYIVPPPVVTPPRGDNDD